MPRYLLPKNKSLPQTTPGQWKELSKTEFTTFISEMEVSPDSKINVTSIPSPWARMLLFKEAVKSTNHLMHQEAMSSILDVMEIIFYNQLMNIDIEYKEIKINSDVNNKFLKILYDLSPDELKTDEILKTDDIFEELLEAYPSSVIRTDGVIDYLRTDQKSCKLLYIKTTKNSRASHEHILKCLNFEVEKRNRDGSMKFMPRMSKWLTQEAWKSYEDEINKSVIPVNTYGTDLE